VAETAVSYQLLAVFVAVAEQASFTKAARKLGIGKGTVSRAIAQLERQLGAELVHRTTHAVALSTAGTALYERTAKHLAALDQAVQKLPERANEPSGVLRLTAPYDFGLVVLPEVLAQFARRYPDVHVDVRLTNTVVDLVAEGFDLAIRGGMKIKDSSLTVRRLGIGGAGWYASPTYVARRGRPRDLGDTRHDWIVHSGLRAVLKLPVETPSRFLCNDFLMTRNLAAAGGGVCMLPAFVAEPYVREGLLEPVPLADDSPFLGGGSLVLLYPSSGQVPRKVSAFRDFLIEQLKARRLDQ
jgi:DNA-binding transcriptional LysR family regulator